MNVNSIDNFILVNTGPNYPHGDKYPSIRLIRKAQGSVAQSDITIFLMPRSGDDEGDFLYVENVYKGGCIAWPHLPTDDSWATWWAIWEAFQLPDTLDVNDVHMTGRKMMEMGMVFTDATIIQALKDHGRDFQKVGYALAEAWQQLNAAAPFCPMCGSENINPEPDPSDGLLHCYECGLQWKKVAS